MNSPSPFSPPTADATPAPARAGFPDKERRLFRLACVWAAVALAATGSYFALRWLALREFRRAINFHRSPQEVLQVSDHYFLQLGVSLLAILLAVIMMTIFLIRWVLVRHRNRQQWPSSQEDA